MSLFRVIEGIVSTRPPVPLGDFTSDGLQATAADVPFNFGGLRKDIHIENDQPVLVKFNSSSNPGMTVAAGAWDWSGEFASSAFVTFSAPTNFKIFANG